jgi:long-chain acyl-CoA synthetase
MDSTDWKRDEYLSAAPIRTICDLFYRSVDKFDKDEHLRFKRSGRWQSLSSRELRQAVEETALGLAAVGLSRGERLAILSENRPEWAIADLAALCLGAQVTPIHHTLPAEQGMSLLRDCEAVALMISSAALAERFMMHGERPPRLRHVVLFGGEHRSDGILTWRELRARGAVELSRDPSKVRGMTAAVRPEDVATLVHTSGTTGEPKGVLLTHANIVSDVLACRKAFPQLDKTDVALSFLPLSHMFERTGGQFLLLHTGATIVYAESTDRVMCNLIEIQPTVLCAVPRFFERLRDHVERELSIASPLKRRLLRRAIAIGRARFRAQAQGAPLSPALWTLHFLARRLALDRLRARCCGRLRTAASGGAPLPPDVAELFGAIGMPIQEGYGLTETSPVIAVNPRRRVKPGSAGRAVVGAEMRLAPDGELLVRGPMVTSGYNGQPEETARAIDDEGWLHTGDIVHADIDGYLYVIGSKKELIVTSGGKKIAPDPIERILKNDPFVDDAIVLGDGRRFIVALVVPNEAALASWAREKGIGVASHDSLVRRPESTAFIEERVVTATSHLASFETVKKVALLSRGFSLEAGEVTPKLSLRRKAIARRYKSVIDMLYEHV